MDTYSPPKPEELRAMFRVWSISQRQASTLLAVNDRTARRWVAGEREMTFASLYTLVHRHTNYAITPDGWRKELALLIKMGDAMPPRRNLATKWAEVPRGPGRPREYETAPDT